MMLFSIVVSLTQLLFLPGGGKVATLAPLTGKIAPVRAEGIHLEAADATMTGNELLQKIAGFTGKGYAGDFIPDGAKIAWTVPNAHAGMYMVTIHYNAPDKKGYDLVVNGKKSSGMFTGTGGKFDSISAGRVELVEGINTIAIERGWGYYQINSIDFTPAKPIKPLRKVPTKLSDSKATAPTRALFSALVKSYGKKTLSGQVSSSETDYLVSMVGRTPAVQASDFIEYSPTRVEHGANPNNEVEKMIETAKKGQIVTMLWHWNAPSGVLDAPYKDKNGKTVEAHWYSAFYTTSTTFDLEAALNDTKSSDYALLLSNIDTIAAQMKKFSDAGVPVLWRPLHEAEGGWFWWGAKGPEPFKKLWRLMYDRMTNYHNLHNLIWVYSSGTDPKWYPGDDVVDIIGIDQYPSDASDPLANVWDTLLTQYDGRKMLALTEFGGVPDIEKMRRFGVQWSYFASWQGDLGPRKHSKDELTRLYNAPSVVTLKELPTVLK